MGNPFLEFRAINKGFFGVPVLRDIEFSVDRGRILGLVGENGAGKSTLMNILGGVLAPDAGSMHLASEGFAPADPSEAGRRGIAFIHQELNLFTNLNIGENLFIPAFPRRGPLIDRPAMRKRARELLEVVDLHRHPETLVEDLSPGERQLVEIARALTVDARLIILDEPTTSLTAHEADRLFRLISRLRERGITMIFISHNLDDVLRLCDDLAVLRDGELVGSGRTADFTIDQMIAMMVGRGLGQLFPERSSKPTHETVLDVEGLSQPGIIERVSFNLHRGEVLGVAGLMGSGRTELARILFGLEPFERGEVRLRGEPLGRASTRERIRRGMAFLTEDRREEGLMMAGGIAENIALVSLSTSARRGAGFIDRHRLDGTVEEAGRSVGLRSSGLRQAVKTLSGGNQQKVVLAKWLLAGPSILMLDEPTRGVDVGAKQEIYRLIDELAGRGAGVLMISSEIEELMGLCDRIVVMSRGELRGSFARAEFDREAILRAALRAGDDS